MRKRIVTTLIALISIFCIALISACENESTSKLEKITLDVTEVTLTVGETKQVIASLTPEDVEGVTVEWSSSNTAVATVNDGLITAVAEGTATITAKADGQSATCAVTVNPASSASVDVEGKTFICTKAEVEKTPGSILDDGIFEQMKNPENPFFKIYENSYYSFKAGGEFEILINETGVQITQQKSFNGTYTQDGNIINIVLNQPDETTSPATATVDGDNLIFYMDTGMGYALILTLEPVTE